MPPSSPRIRRLMPPVRDHAGPCRRYNGLGGEAVRAQRMPHKAVRAPLGHGACPRSLGLGLPPTRLHHRQWVPLPATPPPGKKAEEALRRRPPLRKPERTEGDGPCQVSHGLGAAAAAATSLSPACGPPTTARPTTLAVARHGCVGPMWIGHGTARARTPLAQAMPRRGELLLPKTSARRAPLPWTSPLGAAARRHALRLAGPSGHRHTSAAACALQWRSGCARATTAAAPAARTARAACSGRAAKRWRRA